MTLHKSPQRRSVRQKSGHKVAGAGTGSTCNLVTSNLIKPINNKIIIQVESQANTLKKAMLQDIGIIGMGAYVYPENDCRITCTLTWTNTDTEEEFELETKFPKVSLNEWGRIGGFEEIEIEDELLLENLKLRVEIETNSNINIYGIMLGTFDAPILNHEEIYKAFHENNKMYIPEILYLDPEMKHDTLSIIQGEDLGEGKSLVSKSCNRCTRFLPIDIENERNALGYSNHCVKNAPCNDTSFKSFKIENDKKNTFNSYKIGDKIITHHGFQLECRPCKKFFVNLALNSLRDSTQHREDSLRRRAFEDLIGKLFPDGFTYRRFEIEKGKKFDVHIWKKFDKKCFNCDLLLETPNEMDLDHTRPLAFLWNLDETATCLCSSCNSSKSDKFPVDFYNKPGQIEDLAQLTGLSVEELKEKSANVENLNKILENVEWFLEEFLGDENYQKIREGKKTSDLILKALHNTIKFHNKINHSEYPEDLVKVYFEKTGKTPTTVSVTKKVI